MNGAIARTQIFEGLGKKQLLILVLLKCEDFLFFIFLYYFHKPFMYKAIPVHCYSDAEILINMTIT